VVSDRLENDQTKHDREALKLELEQARDEDADHAGQIKFRCATAAGNRPRPLPLRLKLWEGPPCASDQAAQRQKVVAKLDTRPSAFNSASAGSVGRCCSRAA
jgi:hypothetical protein